MKSLENSFWFVCSMILVLFSLGLLFASTDFIRGNMIKESKMVYRTLGEEATREIQERADRWYIATIEKPQVEEALMMIIPTREERERSRGLEDLGSPLWPWVADRISCLMDMIYWLYRRVALLLVWLPACLPALVLSVVHGLLERKIKQTNFGYASPIVHRYSWRICGWAIGFFLLSFLLPIAISPEFIPFMIATVMVMMGMSLGNMVKRF